MPDPEEHHSHPDPIGASVDLPSSADVVIVGAGLMGSAAAWEASRRGLDVVLLEQFLVNHQGGSSHGSARIVRRAYPDGLYVRLTGLAMERWRELEHDGDVRLLQMTGGLDYGSDRDPTDISSALAAQEVEHELLPDSEAGLRWPGMCFDGPVLFHPQAGTVDADRAVQTALGCARRRGATVIEGLRVQEIRPEEESAMVLTDRGTIRAARVVVAAGAWTGDLLAGLLPMPELVVTQQQVFHFPRRDLDVEWPITLHRSGLDVYHLPGGRDGGPDGARKVADHAGTPTTVGSRSGVVDPLARERIVDYVRATLPGLVPEPFNESTCLYTRTANTDFVIDTAGPVVVASPCSGHGAKFAPLVGAMVMDLVTGEAYPEARFTMAAHHATSVTA